MERISILDSKIKEGIRLIKNNQQPDGGFLSLATPDRENFSKAKTYYPTFFSSLILSCLSAIDDSNDALIIKTGIRNFLLSQKNPYWSFNYWNRNSPEAFSLPYPDDLDDTFCALSALYLNDKDLFDGEALAHITRLLIAAETAEGGPYRTWLAAKDAGKAWQDVDLAVNSNIAFFLSLAGVKLPKLTRLCEEAIIDEVFLSPYYPSCYPVIYFISRFYRGNKKSKLAAYLLDRRSEYNLWDNSLNSALAISSLINLGIGASLKDSFDNFVYMNKDNNFSPHAFCIDPSIDGKTYYSGAESLTAAFCLEALDKIRKMASKKNTRASKPEAGRIDKKQKILKKIKGGLKARIREAGKEIEEIGQKIFHDLLSKDKKGEIALLAYYFNESLGKIKHKISDDQIIKLGMANCYGWSAYSVYDDFLDNEGDPKLLSFANLALRELTCLMNGSDCAGGGFSGYYNRIMDLIDSANTWENFNCRMEKIKGKTFKIPESFPDYGSFEKFYERSLGHSLGPMAILHHLGYDENSKEHESVCGFFQDYLIARQLNDDLHDWEKDLCCGQLNCVGTAVLKKYLENNNEAKLIDLQDEKILEALRLIVYQELIYEFCQEIKKCTQRAREFLAKNKIIQEPQYLYPFLEPLEQSADEAYSEGKNALEFISIISRK